MAKRSWFSLVKRLFTSDTQSNRKKEKKRRWLFGKQKVKRLTSVSSPIIARENVPCENVDEQNSLAATISVIIIETPAAVVKLTDQNEQINEEVSHVNDQITEHKPLCCQRVGETEEAAAIKIQTAFRGYLARKALRALKGVVILQALIRGRAVRRQCITTLMRLQSVVSIQSQIYETRIKTAEETLHFKQNKELLDFRGRDIKIDVNSQRRWDDSILTKEEENALFTSKRDAAMKRERIKEYAFNHRLSTESDQNKVNGKWRYWLEQWVDTQLAKQDLQNPDASIEDLERRKRRLRNFKGLDSTTYFPRRSYHKKQHSIGDNEGSFYSGGSPVLPTYMAATVSAKAKARSMSSPRLRPSSLDTCSDTTSPYKHKLMSPISSINSDATSMSRVANIRCRSFSQRSPSLRGVPGHVKSKKTSKDLGFNAHCANQMVPSDNV